MSFFFEHDLYQKYLNKTIASTNLEKVFLQNEYLDININIPPMIHDHYSFRMYENFPKK